MKRFAVAVLALLTMGAAPSDYQGLLETLHIAAMRPGADGMNPKAPNYANFDEARSGA